MTKPSYKELMARFGAVDMLPNNPFYILGLPAEATPRQIRRRKEDLEAAYELGDKDWNASFPYLLKGSSIPSFELVKDAFARLEDVENRLVASYFWFWTPNGEAGDKFKPAFHSFISGDSELAKDSWQKLKDDYSQGICLTPFLLEKEPQEVVSEKIATALKGRKSILLCAKHNLGVLHRLRAMVVEYALIAGNACDYEESVKDLEVNWRLAHAYERKEDVESPYIVYGEHVKVHQSYYEVFKALDFVTSDLQVSDVFLSLCSMITHDLPVVWQLRMIMAFSRKEDEDSVKRHVSVIRKNIGWHSLTDSVLESVFGDMIASHESLIKRYDEKVRLNHSEGLNVANDLFDATSKDYDAVHAIFDSNELKRQLQKKQSELARCRHADGTCAGADNQIVSRIEKEISRIELHLRFASDTYDPVVQAYLRYIIKYSDVIKDWKIAIEWDELLSKLAVSDKLKETVNKDLRSIFKVRLNDLIEHCLAEVKADSKLGLWAVQELFEKSKELLKTLDARYGASSEIIKEARNNIAGIGRVFLVAYGNATADWSACLKWIKELRAIAEDAKVVALLESDQKTVIGNVQQALAEKRIISMSRPRNEVSPAANIGWVVVLVIITVVMIGVYKESKHKEIGHSRYVPTKAHVTRVEEWERVRKTKSGMVKSREPYYKVYYEYLVGNKTYVDSKRQSKMPENFITVYYDPEKPGNSTTKRHKSLGSLVGMVLAILISMVLIPINIIMFCKKMRKRCGNYDG